MLQTNDSEKDRLGLTGLYESDGTIRRDTIVFCKTAFLDVMTVNTDYDCKYTGCNERLERHLVAFSDCVWQPVGLEPGPYLLCTYCKYTHHMKVASVV